MKNIIKEFIKKNKLRLSALVIFSFLISFINSYLIIDMIKQMLKYYQYRQSEILISIFWCYCFVVIIKFIFVLIHKYNLIGNQKQLEYKIQDKFIQRTRNLYIVNDSLIDKTKAEIKVNIPAFSAAIFNFVGNILNVVFTVICGFVYGMTLNINIMLLILAILALFLFLNMKGNKTIKEDYAVFTQCDNDMYNSIWEQLQNREIVSFLNIDRLLEKIYKINEIYLKSLEKFKKVNNRSDLFEVNGAMILLLVTALCGGIFVHYDYLRLEELLAFLLLIPNISTGFFSIPKQINELYKIKAQYKILNKDYENLKERVQIEKTNIIKKINTITFTDVCFGFNEGNKVLDEINLTLTSSKLICVVGESGCGKTTLFKLLAKYIEGYSGIIKLNQNEISEISHDELWENVQYFSTMNPILNASLEYNVALNPVIDKKRIISSLEKADIDSRFSNEKLNEKMTQSLSSGERQKVNIARFFYHCPQVAILDEVTSAMDPQSERIVVKNILEYVHENRGICIFITHRLIPLEYADQIVYMEKGRINSVGIHKTLYSTIANYRKLLGEEGYNTEEEESYEAIE